MKICPIILSGGSGTRLWPLSRSHFPKQFVNLINESSLFIETLNRLKGFSDQVLPPLIICNADHYYEVEKQMNQKNFSNLAIILEPCSKNTAPAIMLAAAYLERKFSEDVLMLVMPADHNIESADLFQASILSSTSYAEDGSLCTFGITPNSPHTGYGYIEVTKKTDLDKGNKNTITQSVKAFIEKPSEKKAQEYIDAGNYFWNSGIFLFSRSKFIEVLKKSRPLIHDVCLEAIKSTEKEKNIVRPNKDIFDKCPPESIDYAVMEEALDLGISIHMEFLESKWSDLGSWNSLFEICSKDEQGNIIKGDILSFDTKDSFLQSEDKLLATVGIKDMIIVNTKDALLVASIKESEKVKEVVNQLISEDRVEVNLPAEVRRPWGTYESIATGSNFQVKRIKVFCGQQLSLQMHQHRSEHWIVVSGEATVTNGDEITVYKANESTFIPLGVKHSLANLSDTLLEIIEIQYGDYLGEDDIVRFEDQYGRADPNIKGKKNL